MTGKVSAHAPDRVELAGERCGAAARIPRTGHAADTFPADLTLDVLPHPLTTERRRQELVELAPGTPLAAVVAGAWREPSAPLVAVNGRIVPTAAWAGTRLEGGEIVTLRGAVEGDEDSDPLRVLLTIAVIAASIYVPTASWGLGLEAGSASAFAAGAAISLGGRLLVNAIAPPPLPDARPSAAPDPVWSLTGGQNQARPYQPLPLVLGSHRVFPDLSASPYNRYEGSENDQYLYSAFNFGLGGDDLDIDDLKVGGTLWTALADAERSWSNDLLDGDVATVAGAALTDATAAGWTTKAVAAGAKTVELDFAARAFQVASNGAFQAHTVHVEIQLFATVAGSSEPRRVLYNTSLMGDSPTPVRKTFTITLPTDDPQPADGQTWQVRCKRQSAPSADDNVHDDVSWQAMRSIQPDETDYSGQRRLSIRLRATDQLSGTLDRLSATAFQRVPVWDGSAWTRPQRSSNPAWIFRWFARGLRIGGRLVAGAGLPDERIDDDGLKRWGAWCDAQKLYCNHVLTAPTSVHDVLALIAQCGRASPTWAAGRLGVVFEDAARLPTALITPGNIVAGTLEIDYSGGQKVDEVAVRYVSPALDWQLQTLRRRAAGVTTPAHTATVPLTGVTNDRQAAIAANLLLAAQTWRRRRIRWQMGPAALTQIHRGDVVWLSHSLLDGGDAGRLSGIEGAEVTLDREVDVADGDHVLLMLPDGTLHATTVDGDDGTTATITLASAPPAPGAGDAPWDPADVLWRLYSDAADSPARVRILSVEPQSEDVVRLTAVDDPPEYHAAATADLTLPDGAVPAVPPVVVSVFAWTELVDTAAGEVALVHVGIEVAGRWRGGDVWVSTRGGLQRVHQGHIGEIERTLAWIAPVEAHLTIHVIPLGNPDGAAEVEHDVDGPSSIQVLRFRGNWISGESYKIGDVVAYEGRSYASKLNHIAAAGNRPSGQDRSNTTWTLFAAKGAPGAPGAPGPRGASGLPGADGTDGNGYEYIYARSARDFVIASTDKPLRTWTFDQVGTAGILVGRLRWHDGDPGRSASKPRGWFAWRHARGNPPNPSLINGGRWSEPVTWVEDGQDATPPAPFISHSGQTGCVRFGSLQMCSGYVRDSGSLGHRIVERFTHAFESAPFIQVITAVGFTATATATTITITRTPGGDLSFREFRYMAWGTAAS